MGAGLSVACGSGEGSQHTSMQQGSDSRHVIGVKKKRIETRSITTRQNASAKWLSESPCTKDKCPGEMTQIDEGDAYVTRVSTALGAQQMVVFLSLVFPPQMER